MNKKMSELMEKRIGQGREYRRMAVPMEARAGGDNERTVEGYATTFGQPYVLMRDNGITIREQVAPGAFEGCDMGDVIMQYDHEGRVFARMSNGTLRCEPDEHGLHVTADLSGTELGRQVYSEIKGGYSDKMSFGFIVDEDERKVTEDHETGNVDFLRTITKIRKLFDVSVVSIPANDATEITARGADGGVTGWALQEVQALRERRRKEKILSLKLKLMED